jgi:hypothetical protein
MLKTLISLQVRNKIIIVVLIVIVATQSIYFKKLSDHNKVVDAADVFKAKADSLILIGVEQNNVLLTVESLQQQVNNDFAKAKNQSGNRLGIGESAYFLVQTTSKVMAIEDGKWSLADGSVVDTKYIFGNEIRDASRFVHLEDYSSQNDLNAFTEYLNNYIRDTKIAGESKHVKVGDEVHVIGASEIHPNNLPIDHLYIYPVTIKK